MRVRVLADQERGACMKCVQPYRNLFKQVGDERIMRTAKESSGIKNGRPGGAEMSVEEYLNEVLALFSDDVLNREATITQLFASSLAVICCRLIICRILSCKLYLKNISDKVN